MPAGGGRHERIAVVTVSYNTISLISLLLWSLHRVLSEPPAQVVVVDNGSTDGSAALLEDLARAGMCALIANTRNEHHGPAINQAMAWLATQEARPDWVWILDSDVVIARPDALTAAVTVARREGAALLGETSWDRWRDVERLELFALLLNPAPVWTGKIPPFDAGGDPAWPVIDAASRAGLGVVPFPFATDGYVVHRGRGTLAAVAENRESDNPLYTWALDHREPHFGGVDGGREKYDRLCRTFGEEVPALTSEALVEACRSAT